MRAVLAVVLAGCFSPAPKAGAPCAQNLDCPDGLECNAENKCEKPGTSADASIDACPAARCEGDMLVGCGDPIACSYGCLETGEPHCAQLAPVNGVPLSLLDGATADIMIPDLDFDTDNGELSSTDDNQVKTIHRPAGVGVINGVRFEVIDGNGIFAASSWHFVTPDDTDATGTPPLVVLARTTITVAAVLDVGGAGSTGGPGASNGNSSTTTGGCRGKAGRSNSTTGAAFGEGGGGGGAVTAGGAGAPSNLNGETGVGGTSCAAAPDTIPLRGGNGGGHGGQATGNAGGGGGGAVMLVALESITIESGGGAVAAPGAGGLTAATGSGGGGGGGSGGAILLEAPIVNVMGAVTANGGGGGSPAGGTDGNRGTTTTASAAAGGAYACVETPGATPITRRGGAGAAGSSSPGAGANCTQQDAAMVTIASQGGGGGGARGRIHIRRRSGTTSGVQSPTATVEDVTFE